MYARLILVCVTGMDTLNAALMELLSTVPQNQWRPVTVVVAPSTITVADEQVS
jgi:hypothetical protein